jgi:hypothetical protein
MMKLGNYIYIRKLNKQELAYSGGTPGRARGQYLLVSKLLSGFFPPLTQTVLNDTQLLRIIPSALSSSVWARLVYHNDKYHGSTAKNPRNEIRLYLNNEINPANSFMIDDFIIILPIICENGFEGDKVFFKIIHVSPISHPTEHMVMTKVITQRHKIVRLKSSPIDLRPYIANVDCETLEADTLITSDVENVVLEKPETLFSLEKKSEEKERPGRTMGVNERAIRDVIFKLCDYKCAVTGMGMYWQDGAKTAKSTRTTVEGAHIQPDANGGPYIPQNVIPLRKDIHLAFDRGLFTIEKDCVTIKVHKNLLRTSVSSDVSEIIAYHGKPLKIPSVISLGSQYVNFHSKTIFGSFITGKSIRKS